MNPISALKCIFNEGTTNDKQNSIFCMALVSISVLAVAFSATLLTISILIVNVVINALTLSLTAKTIKATKQTNGY